MEEKTKIVNRTNKKKEEYGDNGKGKNLRRLFLSILLVVVVVVAAAAAVVVAASAAAVEYTWPDLSMLWPLRCNI